MFVSAFLFALVSSVWTVPESDVLQAELAPLLVIEENEGASVPAKLPEKIVFEDVVDILRRSSVPIRNYLDQCDALAWQELPFAQPATLPQIPLNIHVSEGQTNYLFGSLRYYLARRLVQARLFDEAKTVLQDLIPENSIDPAGVLIAKALVFHHFSEKEEGLAALKDFQKVAERESISRRSAELAKMLQFEWEAQERDEDPQKISRQMSDVRRRLGQGRTDDDTQEAEEGVMRSLEKLIEKIEEQARRQSQQGKQGQQGIHPPEDSYRLSQKGSGNVDRRDFSQGESWGDLPPKEREEALLKIEKEFPAYYRDIIEQYFREMAK